MTLSQAMGHGRSHPMGVCKDEPGSRRLPKIRWPSIPLFGHNHRLPGIRALIRRWGHRGHLGKPALFQQGLPRADGEQRIVGSQRMVRESPPPLGQPKGQIQPALTFRAFKKHQYSPGRQQGVDVLQCLAQIPGRMEHIGGHHHMMLMLAKSLILGGLFNVQELAAHKGIIRKGLAGLGCKQGGDVGEPIVRLVRRKVWQQMGGGASRARADLHHAQPVSLGQRFDCRQDHLLDNGVHHLRAKGILIYLRGGGPIPLGKQQLERVTLAPQHLGQSPATAVMQYLFGACRRMIF